MRQGLARGRCGDRWFRYRAVKMAAPRGEAGGPGAPRVQRAVTPVLELVLVLVLRAAVLVLGPAAR